MKPKIILVGLLALLPAIQSMAALDFRSKLAGGGNTLLNDIVAVVNEEVIVRTELVDKMRELVARIQQRGTPMPPEEVLARQVLEKLIIEELQLQTAEKLGIRVDDQMVDQSLRRLAESNRMSVAELREAVEADGMNYIQFREDMRKEITLRQLRNRKIDTRIVITEREVDLELARQARQGDGSRAEYLLYHILIAAPEAPSPEELELAENRVSEVMERLRDGANFQETAISWSQGQHALDGGDLGWRHASQIPTLFVETVTNMEPGDVSQPIRSPAGFHILYLADARGLEQHIITQTRARHILLKPDAVTTGLEQRERLNKLRDRILAGEDFADLARAHSQDPVSASNGGDLDWVNPGDMVPLFEEQMLTLESGEISKPFETQFGWHIVQVQDKRVFDSTDEVKRNRAREQLRERKVEEETALWIRRLRDEAYVEYRM